MVAAPFRAQVNRVVRNLTKQEKDTLGDIDRGLLIGGLLVQRGAQGLTPVLTGNLRSGAFTESVAPLHVVVGFQADYAIFVHENMEAAHSVGQAKFLEKSVVKNKKRVLALLKKEASI